MTYSQELVIEQMRRYYEKKGEFNVLGYLESGEIQVEFLKYKKKDVVEYRKWNIGKKGARKIIDLWRIEDGVERV
jgi:hypothetical protein